MGPQTQLIKNTIRSIAYRKIGGGSGIRTRDTVSRIHTFQACAFNHSATPPQSAFAGPAGPLNYTKSLGG
jgi:hypothetical protein